MTILNTTEQYTSFAQAWTTAAKAKSLTAGHHLLYNLVMGRDYRTGFTPLTNLGRIQATEGGTTNGLFQARHEIVMAKTLKGPIRDRFLAPFADAITEEMLLAIELPVVDPLPFNYGLGKKVFAYFAEHGVNNISYEELQTILHAVVTPESVATAAN